MDIFILPNETKGKESFFASAIFSHNAYLLRSSRNGSELLLVVCTLGASSLRVSGLPGEPTTLSGVTISLP